MYHPLLLWTVLALAALAACSAPGATSLAPTAPPPAAARPGAPTPIPPTAAPSGAAPETFPAPAAHFPDPPERDVYRLAAELIPGFRPDSPRTVGPPPETLETGRVDAFWLADLSRVEMYQSQFRLALVSPRAYWYFEDGVEVDRERLERSAALFEEKIYPGVASSFGSEWSPGVDGDPRITILNGALRGAGGYFSSSDEYPRAIFRYSNQREMVYLNAQAFPAGSRAYHSVLTHELQHLVHWRHDASEETWVNEGLSELAVSAAGFGGGSGRAGLDGVPTSLVHWPQDGVGVGANYRTAALFMHYLAEHYGSREDMRALVETPGDGITGIDEYLKQSGYLQTFRDVFRDWAIANFLDLPRGVYGYPGLHVRARAGKSMDGYGELRSEIPQYSVEYVAIRSLQGPARIDFDGAATVDLLPAEVGPEGCWWSNSGDAIASELSAAIDLRGVARAALRYRVWHDIEETWDYAYVQASTDGGKRWDILAAPGTSPENPMGNGFGNGYTGRSGGWIAESVDLSPFAGQQVQIRFQYVTDDAVHGPGLCLHDAVVVKDGRRHPIENWQAAGFIRTGNLVSQGYIVQAILQPPGRDGEPRVVAIELDPDNSGFLEIQAPQELERLTIAVAALAPRTFQPAPYVLTAAPGR